MFKDTKKGTTHFYGDGCGEPMHNNFYQVGKTLECGHCRPDKFNKCDDCKCLCHQEAFKKENLLRCHVCHKPFVKVVDPITKEVSEYLWRSNCACHKGKPFMVSVG